MTLASITVSYSGVEKRVPLAVTPSLELSDDQVNNAELDLHNKLRSLFQVPSDVQFYLHEAETSRVMSKESFREYTSAFPSHWYLVNNRDFSMAENGCEVGESTDDIMALTTPPELTTPPSDDMSSDGVLSDGEISPQLCDLTSLPEESYSTLTVHCDHSGTFGFSLRHFTIQSDSSQRPDTPLNDNERPDSQLSGDSIELKLSTAFVYKVVEGGEAEGVGLEEGQVIHMINGVSIIRSSTEEIRHLIEQCDEKVTLLTLPKEHDDLQFLYPRYTYGPTGSYCTKDGQVTTTDIKLVRSKLSNVKQNLEQRPTISNHVIPPSGMMLFNEPEYTSQENSQSCDIRQSSHDDILVEGSLMDIETHPGTRVKGHHKSSGHSSAWYNDDFSLGQEVAVSNQIIMATSSEMSLLPQQPLPVKVRTRSNSSLESRALAGHNSQGTSSNSGSLSSRPALASSMSALDRIAYSDRARSTDLGRLKIKKKGNKSLEGLTRIASDSLQQRISIRLPVKKERSQPQPPPETKEPTSSSQHKRTAARGYQKKRMALHAARSSRSKIVAESSVSNSVEHMNPIGGGSLDSDTSGGRSYSSQPPTYQGQRSQSASQDNEVPISLTTARTISDSVTSDPVTPPRLEESRAVAVMRGSGRGESPGKNRHNRPMSAVEPVRNIQQHRTSLQVPFSSETPKKIPIFKTRSTGGQVFREVNIEEAIAASQTEGASQGDRWRIPTQHSRSQSIDVSSVLNDSGVKKRSRKLFGNRKQGSMDMLDGSPDTKQGLGSTSALLRLSNEVLNTIGLPSPNQDDNIRCHGVLSKKQDLLDSGRRAGDRSWHSFYAVLASNKISFYRDRKEARLRASSDEPPLVVVPSRTDYAINYTRKKFVFKVKTKQGAVYLLQATDAPSLKNWVTAIHELNGGPPSPEATDRRLAPPSPNTSRRASSPGLVKGRKEEGSRGFLNRIRRRVRRRDEPDFSSYITFGQLLEDCPASLENKKVPLAVEYCVKTIEGLGIDVEGIYRKPGTTSQVKHMSSEMDRGMYDFPQEDIDIHTVASLLKKFFKELPDPMIPDRHHDQFLACARLTDEASRLARLQELVLELPSAHYHTLKYLMLHLRRVAGQSDLNKMTPRNVALVFGPTLMSKQGGDLLNSMNESYTIVEALCRHVDHLFSAELCYEEDRQSEHSEPEEGGVSKGSPALRHREQKDMTLASATSQSVRRIQNNLSDDSRPLEPHHSLLSINGSSLPPKQSNWQSGAPRGTNHSLDSGGNSPGGEDLKQRHRRTQHVYEDVERRRPQHSYEDVELSETRSESRTNHWVTAHSELGWGRREGSGSMWAPHNRSRHPPRRQESLDRERELVGTYHGGGGNSRSYSQRPKASSKVVTPSSPVRRRVSYVSAMGGPSESRDHFTASYATSSRTPSRHSSMAVSQQYPTTSRGYESLQRPTSTLPVLQSPRRGFDSGSSRPEPNHFEQTKAMLRGTAPGNVPPAHRSMSFDTARGSNEIVRSNSGRRVEQAYVKQSEC